MRKIHCDLNDIQHEPSDEQLAALMEAVAKEARKRAQAAKERLMEELRSEVEKAVSSRTTHG